MPRAARFPVVLLATAFAIALAPPLVAQDGDDPFATIDRAKAICAIDAMSAACHMAQARSVAIVADALAEAGNSKDRGSFIDPVRALLHDPSPEIRTAALYALAKLGPDAGDTASLLALARDPVSNVRAGAWAAAGQSPDPAARRLIQRVAERPSGKGYAPDGPGLDSAALGLELPDGLAPLGLAADLRERGQAQFLTETPAADLLAELAPLADEPARPLTPEMAYDPTLGDALAPFLDPRVYGAPHVLSLAATAELPVRHLLVFDDLVFGQTGLAVIFADGRSLVPKAAPPPDLTPDALPEDAAFDAALLRRSGLKPGADPEETDLFLAIAAAGGFGAAEYLEVYPDGAYAEEARALLAAPQLVLGAISFADTEDIGIGLANLPETASAELRILSTGEGAEMLIERTLHQPARETLTIEPDSRLGPGVYRVIATVDPGDGGAAFSVMRDFEVTLGRADLAADKAEYAPGEPITVRFSSMSGDSQDYVATAPAGSPNQTFLRYAYTEGARDGSLTLLAPDAPGAYELRAFFREDESILRGSLPFTVAGTAAPATASPSPATPGVPDPDARATLGLDKDSYAPGETISVTFAGMFGHPQDYVATVAAGAPYSSYLQYRYTDGNRAGTVTLTAPTASGPYELRAFFMEDESILRASQPFTVTGDPASPAILAPTTPDPAARAVLALDKPVYAPGETITVTYAEMFGHPQDYVSTAPAGSPQATYMAYRYTEGARSGTATLTAPGEPGAYEVRAFFMEDEAILRGSVPFEVR